MQHQRAGIPDVSQVGGQLQGTDELGTNVSATSFLGGSNAEGEDRAYAQRQELLTPLVVGVSGQASVVDVGDAGIGIQPLDYGARICQVGVHALRQGLNALQKVES